MGLAAACLAIAAGIAWRVGVAGSDAARSRSRAAGGTASPAEAVKGLATLAAAAAVRHPSLARLSAPRRRAAIEADLPILLEGIASRLRAGGSLAQALVEAAPPPGRPLAADWRRTAGLVPAVGAVAALDDWAARSAGGPVPLAAAALALAAETGGSPARAVDGVATTLRGRLALAGELRALTSQARASAWVMVGAPVAFAAFAATADPRATAFLRTPAGAVLLVCGLTLDGLGGLWMARLCRVPGP